MHRIQVTERSALVAGVGWETVLVFSVGSPLTLFYKHTRTNTPLLYYRMYHVCALDSVCVNTRHSQRCTPPPYVPDNGGTVPLFASPAPHKIGVYVPSLQVERASALFVLVLLLCVCVTFFSSIKH